MNHALHLDMILFRVGKVFRPHRMRDIDAAYCYSRSGIRYDTIRNAILTCAQNPTRVTLIFRVVILSVSVTTVNLAKRLNQSRCRFVGGLAWV